MMLGPHFVRMAGSFGFMKGYFDDFTKNIIPKPHNITAVSSGAVVATVICPFTKKAFDHADYRFKNLKGSQFFTLNKELIFWGGIEALGPLMLFIPWEKIKNPVTRNIAKGFGAASLEGIELGLIDRLWAANGVFSNERLRKLLLTLLKNDFDDIFKSDINMDIVAANINGDEANDQNVTPYIVTNYKPEHKDKNVLVDGVVRTTSIPGFFPTSQTRSGDFTTDGGVNGAFPIGIPYDHGCNVIIVAQLSYDGQGYLKHNYTKWLSALHRSFDIIVDNHSALVLRGCENINNDLEQIKKLESTIDGLQLIADQAPDDFQTAMNQEIYRQREAIESLTAYGKRHFNLVIIKSRRKIPEFNFRGKNFDKYMGLSIDIGQEAYEDAKSEIHRAIDRVSG